VNNSKAKPLALICGAGSGLGKALCTTFVEAGYQVVCMNRSASSFQLDGVVSRIVDSTDSGAVQAELNDIFTQYGQPQLYVHNPAHLVIDKFGDTDVADFRACWESMVLSAFNLLQGVLPAMAAKGEGCIIVSGATASIRGGAKFSAFASAKFALRGLTQSIAREYQTQGIHVVHVVLDGIIDGPRSRELHSLEPTKMISAEELAELYLQLTQQKPSVWSHEIDVRPHTESF